MKRALISVSDKTGVITLAKALVDNGIEIVSTGGTAKALKEAGVPVINISRVTGFPEILDGRVKTLHPNVHGAILAKDTKDHMAVLEEHKITPIDLVVCNLYPFEGTIAREDFSHEDAIENIDIGGPTMIRSAAKNHDRVAVVVNPDQYEEIIKEFKATGSLSVDTRRQLARQAFEHTARYDAAISDYLAKTYQSGQFPFEESFAGKRIQVLRYGENPHQKAAFYRTKDCPGTVASAKKLQGKDLSYNNIVDLDAAWQLVNEVTDEAACAIIKHTNPCGFAQAETIEEAYKNAYEADSVSAFGGIIASNREVNKETAEQIVQTFMEAIIAPTFTEEALEIFKAKPNLRVMATKITDQTQEPWIERISGGFLMQDRDTIIYDPEKLKVVTKKPVDEALKKDLLFAWKTVKHVKSNAIVIAKDTQTLGVGAGQMNRVGSCEIAIKQAGEKAKGAVLASDAFFPFADSIEAAAKAGISAIIQPGGSIRDEEVIEACDKYGIAMIFTGIRHFKH